MLKRIMRRLKAQKESVRFMILVIVAAVVIPSPISMAMKGTALCIYDTLTGITGKALVTFSQEKAVELYMSNTEEFITNKFFSENGTVIIVEEENVENLLGENKKGCYTRANGISTIYIKKTFALNDPVLYHELGHCLDRELNPARSSSEAFKNVADKEIKDFSIAYFLIGGSYPIDNYKETGDYKEYFAEAYCCYKAYPHMLKMAAPETYNYFVELFEA